MVNVMPNADLATVSGYRNGSNQLSVALTMELPVLADAVFDKFDHVLQVPFELDFPPLQFRIQQTKARVHHATLAASVDLMVRISALANALLQAVRVPAFELAIMLSVELDQPVNQPVNLDQSENKVRFNLLCPSAELVPLPLVFEAHRFAAELALRMLAANWSLDDLPALLDEIQATFVVPNLEKMPGGISTVSFLSTAFMQGVPFSHLGSGIYQLGWGKYAVLSDRSGIQHDSGIGSKLSQNKHLTSRLLATAGLPVPHQIYVRTIDQALQALKVIGAPVVIKPADRDRGEGVTTSVHNPEDVIAAFEVAAEFSKNILVEKEIPGVCYRVTVAHGVVACVIKRNAKFVLGDGVHTVQELVRLANDLENKKACHKRRRPFLLDAQALALMKPAGYFADSIPAEGAAVYLRKIESTEWGGIPEDMGAEIHAENISLAIEAANLLRLDVAGVDIISQDISKPWYSNGAAVNEVNFSPLWTNAIEAAKQGLSNYMQRIFPEQGRILIEVFVGADDALKSALSRQKEIANQGLRCFLSNHNASYGPQGFKIMAFAGNNLFQRARGLLMNANVDVLILVVQTDEWLNCGLPVNSINSLIVCSQQLQSIKSLHQPAVEGAFHQLMDLMRPYVKD